MNRKEKNGIKVLITTAIAIALIAPISILMAAPPSMDDGPLITFGNPKYVGDAPPLDYHGPIEDYAGPTTLATWITSLTPINISMMGLGIAPWQQLWYRMWNFNGGWGAWLTPGVGVEYVVTDIATYFGGIDECLHKIEAEITGPYGTSNYSWAYFYVDSTAPVTTKEYGEPYCVTATEECITSDTPIYLNCTDGEWNINEESCPVGVNGTFVEVRNNDNGNSTGVLFIPGYQTTITMNTLPVNQSWPVFEDCNHTIFYWQIDWLGNEEWPPNNQSFWLDNTEPNITSYNVSSYWYENDIAKNMSGGCFNITVVIEPTGCCPNATPLVQLEVEKPTGDPDDTETVIVNMTLLSGTTYYFPWCNGTITDIENHDHENNTRYYGDYPFTIHVYDCLGNENSTSSKFMVKPLCDIDVIELVYPDPSIWHPEMPTNVTALIKNNGICDVEGPINVHLQIYEELERDPYVYKFWDLESCLVSGLWEMYSWDGDPITWYWTEKRANSPTHSFHNIPDYLSVYEAYAHDSLILSNNSNGIFIPDVYENDTIEQAWVTFSHWVRGEFSGGVPVDYGKVYVRNSTGTWQEVGGPYYENGTDAGEFEDVRVDISQFIGETIFVNWTWFADATMNYEGWYVDDINIDLAGPRQPLVYQQYKYVFDLDQNETKLIEFPLDFVPTDDTWYFFEVYSDLRCCGPCDFWNGTINCSEDIDGPADVNYVIRIDPRTGFTYKDPLNGVNESLYFGDVCDAEVLSIDVDSEFEMPDENVVSVPIQVEIRNNGTLTKDVPVKVSAQHLLTDIIFQDDVESGEHEASSTGFVAGNVESEDMWEITDDEYFSPTHSWHLAPSDLGVGQAKRYGIIEKPYDIKGGLKMEANIKYNLAEHWDVDGYGAFPYMVAETYFWDFGGISTDANDQFDSMPLDRVYPFQGSSGWVHFDADEFIQNNDLYWEERYGNAAAYPQYVDYFNDQGGFDSFDMLLDFWYARYEVEQGSDNFDEVQIGFGVLEPDGMEDDQGFWFDDIIFYNEYGGDVVWEEIKTVEDLEQGETALLNFTWNTSEYCDYIIKAEIVLDCDVDPTNNEAQASTRIYELIYDDGVLVDPSYSTLEAEWEVEDNTCGFDDHWHIVDECSICPDDSFWWCGIDEDEAYGNDFNDWLMINHTFNWTGLSEVYVNFDTFYFMEYDWEDDIVWDTAFLEVSNDSGETWFVVDQYINSSVDDTWESLSYTLEPGVTKLTTFYLTGWGPYGDPPFSSGYEFDMPTSFFTDQMHIRFRFYSDEAEVWKGMYIDNVEIDNGTGIEFFDDMEDAASSEENWTHGYICYGVHWHNTSGFDGKAPTAEWFYNGEEREWGVIGSSLLNATYFQVGYTTSPPPHWTFTGIGPDRLYGSPFQNAGYLDVRVTGSNYHCWANQTYLVLPDSPQIELQFWSWALAGAYMATVPCYDVTITDTAGVVAPYTETITTTSLFFDEFQMINIAAFATCTVNISFDFHYWDGSDPYGYGFEIYQAADVEIWAYLPGLSIPYLEYYNEVDEKLIFHFNLTNAYEAIFSFMQNFSFADEEDLGYVEIYCDGAWKPLLINKGSGTWHTVTLDITDCVNHEGDTLIRFKFISNETGQDYGWLLDDLTIEGKVDDMAPETVATLSPAAPDGCMDWYVSPVTVTLTATDNVKVDTIYYRIDGGVWLTYTAPFSINVDGAHTVDYYAVDTVGNTEAYSSVSFKIDTTNPTGSITFPQAGYIYLFGRELMPRILIKDKALIIGGLTATATASDATSGVDYVTFTTAAGSANIASPYNFNLPFYFPFGSDTLTISVTDNACNTASNVASVDYFKIL